MSDEMIRPSWQDAAERTMVAYEAEKALADDLALALGLWIKYGRPPVQATEAMDRYREARG